MRAIKILVLSAVCVVAASTALAQDMRAAPADPGATQTGMQAVTDTSAYGGVSSTNASGSRSYQEWVKGQGTRSCVAGLSCDIYHGQ